MSYFKKIVDRTLKAESGSLRPAITPDSIPEPFATPARQGAPARRAPSTPSAPAEKQPAQAPSEAPEAKPSEERPPEHAIETPTAPAKKQPAVQEPASFAPEDTTQETPETPHPDAVPPIPDQPEVKAAPESREHAPDQDLMPDNEEAEAPTRVRPVISADEEKPGFAAKPAVPSAAMKVGEAGPASQIKPRERSGIVSKDSPGPERHPQVRPATSGNDKYVPATLQQEETTVTINIGRIEVRAVTPSEPKSPPRKEYSPPLSLGEYLKQRMENKKI